GSRPARCRYRAEALGDGEGACMKEYSCRFGNAQHLVGIITAPDPPPRRLAFVLVTAGVTPKSGPFRLYAELARRVARDGFLAFRFDLGGIGDSSRAGTSD